MQKKKVKAASQSVSPDLAAPSNNPALLQVNMRVWLDTLSCECSKPVTLSRVPEWFFKDLAAKKIQWLWLMSVWTVSGASGEVARNDPGVIKKVSSVIPDMNKSDICGSGFAIAKYQVDPAYGGNRALGVFRRKLASYGVRLMLDFVPNHLGLDHQWLEKHPDYFIHGDKEKLAREPENFTTVKSGGGQNLILAHGRDPNFSGWSDTLQLNYANDALQDAQLKELLAISAKCDGVRCDMAMLLLPRIFEKTWGTRPKQFWQKAIKTVRRKHPGFIFMAEAYWGTEAELIEQGFDYCYDKLLYDLLRYKTAKDVRAHLGVDPEYQSHLVRFLENHDEERAAAVFSWPEHKAAAIVTYLAPGMRFFQLGQETGAIKHLPTQLCRSPMEDTNPIMVEFYDKLFALLATHPACSNAAWALIDPAPAWEGNGTFDNFIAYTWCDKDCLIYVVVINYSKQKSQCYLKLEHSELIGNQYTLVDELGPETYQRQGASLYQPGLYIDLEPFHYNVFCLINNSTGKSSSEMATKTA